MSIKIHDLSFEEQHRLRIDAAIAAEGKAVASIHRMARKNLHSLLALWHLGDGDGGGIMEMVAKEIGKRQTFAPQPSNCNAAKSKKVIPGPLRTKVFERDAYRCVHCSAHIDLCVDHIHPESKGGTLDFDNLQTLCRPCNSSKGAR